MSILIKIGLALGLFTALLLIFPSNLIHSAGVPIASIGNFLGAGTDIVSIGLHYSDLLIGAGHSYTLLTINCEFLKIFVFILFFKWIWKSLLY